MYSFSGKNIFATPCILFKAFCGSIIRGILHNDKKEFVTILDVYETIENSLKAYKDFQIMSQT